MIYQIPLDAVPNQFLTTTINGTTWDITIETRLDKLYISLNDVLYNRVCLDRTPVGHGFMFADIDGLQNPTYTGLGGRHVLLWSDELE